VIDAHPEDTNKVDFYRPRTGTPVMRTVGDYRQVNDALFHAGTGSGSLAEFIDAPNRLHFYVLDAVKDSTGVLSYDIGVRSLDGAGPHTRGVSVARPTMALNPGGLSTCTFSVSNTGATAPVSVPAAPLDDPNARVDNDVYRLAATSSSPGVEVHLANQFAWARPGQSVQVPVSIKGSGGVVTLTATSESDPTKTASAACALTEAPGDVGGTVPATLSLTLGGAGGSTSFGAFRPGTTATYTATTTANVISTAGDAVLSVSDPSPVATGHLVNGTFSLPQPLKAGGSELPAVVKTYSAPVSNDAAQVEFSQLINATDALRTGSYSKTLTFTLSTTTP
jgi:hypothetical protein